MAEIADAAGVEAAWALAAAHGGTTVYIPHVAGPDHWLTELVGAEAASKICRHFATGNSGARVLIPLARQGQQRVRLIRALEDGHSAPTAASAAGMHERSAYRMRKRIKERGAKAKRRESEDASSDRQQKLL